RGPAGRRDRGRPGARTRRPLNVRRSAGAPFSGFPHRRWSKMSGPASDPIPRTPGETMLDEPPPFAADPISPERHDAPAAATPDVPTSFQARTAGRASAVRAGIVLG